MNNLDFIPLTLLTNKKAFFRISSIYYVVENHIETGCVVCLKEDPDKRYPVKESIEDIQKAFPPPLVDLMPSLTDDDLF